MMWTPHHHHDHPHHAIPHHHHHHYHHHYHDHHAGPAARKWVPELSSLANVVVARCARILAISIEELQKQFEKEVSESAKDSDSYASNLLEYCCFKALGVARQNTSYLKDKHFRRLSFDMMIAWEAPDSVAVCIKKCQIERNNNGTKKEEDSALFYSALMPLVVTLKSTVGKQAFVRVAPAISGVADVINAHFQFDALARPTGGRLQFSVYNKYLIELDKALDGIKYQGDLLNKPHLKKGEIMVEVDGTVIQHVGASTWPGRLTLTGHSLYFESSGVIPYGKSQKFDLAADLQQVVKPYTTGPWGIPLFDRAISYKSVSNDEYVILEFPEFLGCSRRDYWLTIIQEVICTHRFIRKSCLEGTGQVEAISRSILGIIRFKATREALRANPARPKSLLCFSMAHVSPCRDLVLKILGDKLKKGASQHIRGEQEKRRFTYAKSAMSILCDSKVTYPSNSMNLDDTQLIGEFFLDELPHLDRVVEQSCKVYTNVDGFNLVVSGEKVDSLSTNLAIMKAVLDSLRPTVIWINVLLSWDEPFKTIPIILLGTSIIMRDLLQYFFALFFVGMVIFIIFFKQAGEGPLSGEIKILSPIQNTAEEVLELQQAFYQLEQLLRTSNIVLLKIRALLCSVLPQATDQVILCLMILAGVVAVLPAKAILLLLFWEAFTRQLPLRQETTECYTRRFKRWWYHIPMAPVCYKQEMEKKARWPWGN